MTTSYFHSGNSGLLESISGNFQDATPAYVLRYPKTMEGTETVFVPESPVLLIEDLKAKCDGLEKQRLHWKQCSLKQEQENANLRIEIQQLRERSGAVFVAPGIEYTASAVEQVLRENQALRSENAKLAGKVARCDELEVQVHRLKRELAARLFADTDTRPYRWDDDSLPFESPEGPYLTDPS